ncbi:hypothetical protein GGTG_09879 [Gaeumannomyces tritici R3-111a-1]|uniref:Uncharacterized protein n=1 Tax=Gaeumannomyces tritici (strain R3-111a-1) TaxID=644352 RepID=J3P8P4_GAET3|nr:hypothetical protein GGTG_09879 [Gaeumannomyces tritici R3-111a-1]EJT73028.1 hypothetical protein GGTG_09879 [Gaeumannomyces tritici R3-111a-1]
MFGSLFARKPFPIPVPAPARAVTVSSEDPFNIAAEAAATISLLDEAASRIKARHRRHRRQDAASAVSLIDEAASWIKTRCHSHRRQDATSAAVITPGTTFEVAAADLGRHDEKLCTIRDLVIRTRLSPNMQTPPVANALVLLQSAVKGLVSISGTASFEQLATAMDKVDRAAKDLRQRLTGDIPMTVGNVIEGYYQIGAAIGGSRRDGPLIIEARGNKATNTVQINAPVFGDPAALAQIFTALQGSGR